MCVEDSYLAEIMESAVSINYKSLISDLQELSAKRLLTNLNKDSLSMIKENKTETIIAEIENRLDSIKKKNIEKLTTVSCIAKKGLDELLKVGRYVSTGLVDLDSKLIGFFDTELIILGARPGIGKSALALGFARSVAVQGKHVLFFSLEMSNQETFIRILANKANFDITAMRSGNLNEQDKTILSQSIQEVEQEFKTLHLIDNAYSLDKIISVVEKFNSVEDIGLIVIDYLQLAEVKSKEPRHLQISQATRALKMLSGRTKAPVLALSQLNRGIESRTNKAPVLSDLRESGSIEQDANVVLFLHQDEEDDRIVDIIVAKNRSGSMGRVPILFQKNVMRFGNLRR